MPEITRFEAIERMRLLTQIGMPFEFTFYSLDKTRNKSNGLKQVNKAILRKGLRNDQSNEADSLIAYTDLDNDKAPRFFRLSLLMSFNKITIKP